MYKAKYLTGSKCFLQNTRDTDYIYYFETDKERLNAIAKKPKHSLEDLHYSLAEPKVFLGCYIYHFMELLEGEDLHLNEFSIFDHKEEYIALLKRYTSWLPKEHKWWYHILTACYMFKNGSYDLNDSQLQAIQRTHDKGITDAKYKFCLDTLEEYSEK